MQVQHWVMIAVVLIVGYTLGVKFPGFFNMAVSKVTGG